MRVGQRLRGAITPLKPKYTEGTPTNYDTELMKLIPQSQWTSMMDVGIGIEVEVEGVSALNVDGWVVERDTSLRNHGWEFKTAYGARAWNVPHLLAALKLVLEKHHPKTITFSERTSIHVHLDVRTFNEGQLQNLLMLYTLSENALFEMAGELRKNNIFCVPIRESQVANKCNSVWDYIGGAHKYTGMNLLPCQNFGTVEFRHMEGNLSIPRLWNWVVLLLMLRHAAKTWRTSDLEMEIRKLKTYSQYETVLAKVYGPLFPLLTWTNGDLDAAVSDAKFFFFPNKEAA